MDSLFKENHPPNEAPRVPLAELMRPNGLEEFVGQDHLLGSEKALRQAIEQDQIPSMILWGPPGVGKTTLAQIIAHRTQATFRNFSAVLSSIKEIKKIMELADHEHRLGNRTILFIDEIHRFNKAQQDAFLSYVEKGSITLIGATTENPSFEVISALLSRVRVFVLEGLTNTNIKTLIERAAARFGFDINVKGVHAIISLAGGDARSAYNILEMTAQSVKPNQQISKEIVQEVAQQRVIIYDKSGDQHYNIISALHKSIRNSDADAGLYWLARMLEAGEDPLYVARRLIRFASEDVGLADTVALQVALNARDAVAFLGLPEGGLALAECVIYLALAPKSNSVYTAYGKALDQAKNTQTKPVPLHLRNPSTPLMKSLKYGSGYHYAHDLDTKIAAMTCLPEGLTEESFYQPTDADFHGRLKKQLEILYRGKNKMDNSK